MVVEGHPRVLRREIGLLGQPTVGAGAGAGVVEYPVPEAPRQIGRQRSRRGMSE